LIDFKKRLAGKQTEKPTDPVKLYETCDGNGIHGHSPDDPIRQI
jgi:hypothetical protein